MAAAYKEPDAKTLVAFTKGKHLALLGMMNALVGEVVKKSCELFGAHKARIDHIEERLKTVEARVKISRTEYRRDQNGELTEAVTYHDHAD